MPNSKDDEDDDGDDDDDGENDNDVDGWFNSFTHPSLVYAQVRRG